nr:hypothetical protein [uncultured Cohaesibacter sp.]
MTAKVILSIDPGITGALAWLAHDPLENTIRLLDVRDVPTVQMKVGKSLKEIVNTQALADIMKNPFILPPSVAVIEDVHAMPGQGVTSMFRFGEVAGILKGIASGLGYPLETMRPQDWQRAARVQQGKDAARLTVSRLFPQMACRFNLKKHHNRADAVLIGYAYASRASGMTPLPTL